MKRRYAETEVDCGSGLHASWAASGGGGGPLRAGPSWASSAGELSALDPPSRYSTQPRWMCLTAELGAARLLVAVICADSLALCGLHVADRAVAQSPQGMDSLRASAVGSALALFSEYLKDPA